MKTLELKLMRFAGKEGHLFVCAHDCPKMNSQALFFRISNADRLGRWTHVVKVTAGNDDGKMEMILMPSPL